MADARERVQIQLQVHRLVIVKFYEHPKIK